MNPALKNLIAGSVLFGAGGVAYFAFDLTGGLAGMAIGAILEALGIAALIKDAKIVSKD
ncbi:MAG: hypothetical protein AAF648_04880 [Pseudomonadota bacterium]